MTNLELLLGGNVALFWVAIGVLALIVEILMPGGFVLSFSISAFVVSATYFFAEFPGSFLERLTGFAVLGVLLILPVRRALEVFRPNTKDINEY